MNLPKQHKALRIGRDPNGATWRIVRDAAAWNLATVEGLAFDPYRDVLELLPQTELPDDLTPAEEAHRTRELAKIPLETVYSCDGSAYRSAPHRHQVMVKRPGTETFVPLPGLGPVGRNAGRLQNPQGLAIDGRGYLYVADSGNHRVQVVRPEDGSVVVWIGHRDEWGEPVIGDSDGAMNEPVDVAIDRRCGTVFVLDRLAERVHVFDSRFRHIHSFTPIRSSEEGDSPMVLAALAVADDGSLLIFDRGWHRLLHMSANGEPLPEVALTGTEHPRFSGLQLVQRLVPEGEAIIGPLDSGIYDVAWHRIFLECRCPDGSTIEMQSYASNDRLDLDRHWAPDKPLAIPLAERDGHAEMLERDRLVLAAQPSGATPITRATDRGQYLWIRLRLIGGKANPGDRHAVGSPQVRGVRALFPRNSYLRDLPNLFSRRDENDPMGAIFLERFLALFEAEFTGFEESYEEFSRLLNPQATSSAWLSWLASWFDLTFDPSWTLDKRRLVLSEIMVLYKRRGTIYGLTRFIEIYTGRSPTLLENFTLRPSQGTVLGREQAIGCSQILGGHTERQGHEFLAAYAHRFTVYVYIDQTPTQKVTEDVVRALIEVHKPAHTSYELRFVLPEARVGQQSTVGLDFVLGSQAKQAAILGYDDVPSPGAFRPVLGSTGAILGGSDAPYARRNSPILDDSPPRIDENFLLK